MLSMVDAGKVTAELGAATVDSAESLAGFDATNFEVAIDLKLATEPNSG